MRFPTFREREQLLDSARTSLIDALRLCDEGKLPEAMVGCAMAMTFLAPITSLEKTESITQQLLHAAVERERLRLEEASR